MEEGCGKCGLTPCVNCPRCYKKYCSKCYDSFVFRYNPVRHADSKICCESCYVGSYDCHNQFKHTCGGDKCLLITTNQRHPHLIQGFWRGVCCVTLSVDYCSKCQEARDKRRGYYTKEINTPIPREMFDEEKRNLRKLFAETLCDNPDDEEECLIPNSLKRIEKDIDRDVYFQKDFVEASKALKRAKITLEAIWHIEEEELYK